MKNNREKHILKYHRTIRYLERELRLSERNIGMMTYEDFETYRCMLLSTFTVLNPGRKLFSI